MDSAFFDSIRRSVSSERLDVYFHEDNADEVTTLARYLWNIALCEALYSPLQMAEVVLRNAIHNTLTKQVETETWYEKIKLQPWQHTKVGEAKAKIARGGKPVTPGRVVSELSFGFWTSFFSNWHARENYSSFILKHAFPGCARRLRTRNRLETRWNTIRILRNRVFHHERIAHWNNLADQHAHLLETIGWMSPEMENLSLQLDRFYKTHHAGIEPWKDTIRKHWPKDMNNGN
jgi:hypothetical protein